MKNLTLNEYQERAMLTCMKTCDNFSYMMLNLVAEVGEFAGKVAKAVRKGEVIIGEIPNDMTPKVGFDRWVDQSEELKKEAGDILWQLAGLCTVMGWALGDVGIGNLEKLASRKERGVIDGSGDNR